MMPVTKDAETAAAKVTISAHKVPYNPIFSHLWYCHALSGHCDGAERGGSSGEENPGQVHHHRPVIS
jgi:hypothetical protein